MNDKTLKQLFVSLQGSIHQKSHAWPFIEHEKASFCNVHSKNVFFGSMFNISLAKSCMRRSISRCLSSFSKVSSCIDHDTCSSYTRPCPHPMYNTIEGQRLLLHLRKNASRLFFCSQLSHFWDSHSRPPVSRKAISHIPVNCRYQEAAANSFHTVSTKARMSRSLFHPNKRMMVKKAYLWLVGWLWYRQLFPRMDIFVSWISCMIISYHILFHRQSIQ